VIRSDPGSGGVVLSAPLAGALLGGQVSVPGAAQGPGQVPVTWTADGGGPYKVFYQGAYPSGSSTWSGLYGVYATRQDAQRAVAELLRRYAPITPGDWRVTRVMVKGDNATAAPDRSRATGTPRKAGPRVSPTVSASQLKAVLPSLPTKSLDGLTRGLSRAMQESGISTPRRQAAFLAQLAVESRDFTRLTERYTLRPNFQLPGSKRPPYTATSAADYFEYWYGNRPNLGNTQPGDGFRYRGRGYIQLTGRANYQTAGRALGLDLENNPDSAADPEVALRVAAWYWQSHGLNQLADEGNVREITRRINGGYNNLSEREQEYRRFREVLGDRPGGGQDTPRSPLLLP
jgi:putative chitinase